MSIVIKRSLKVVFPYKSQQAASYISYCVVFISMSSEIFKTLQDIREHLHRLGKQIHGPLLQPDSSTGRFWGIPRQLWRHRTERPDSGRRESIGGEGKRIAGRRRNEWWWWGGRWRWRMMTSFGEMMTSSQLLRTFLYLLHFGRKVKFIRTRPSSAILYLSQIAFFDSQRCYGVVISVVYSE